MKIIHVGDTIVVKDRYGRPHTAEVIAKLYDPRNRQNSYKICVAGVCSTVAESNIIKELPHVKEPVE